MTRKEAIRILDPATTAEALAEIEYYAGFSGQTAKVLAVGEACEIAVAALRGQLTANGHQLEAVTNRHGLNGWISVKDRLPEITMPPRDVLVYHNLNCGMFVDRAWYSYEKNKWRSAVGMNLKVTHWMPLPEPPEVEG